MKKVLIRSAHTVAFSAIIIGVLALIAFLVGSLRGINVLIIACVVIVGGLVIFRALEVRFKSELSPTKGGQRASFIIGLLLIIFGVLAVLGNIMRANMAGFLGGIFFFSLGIFLVRRSKREPPVS